MVPGLFVTGVGTGVGKTYVAALVARQLRERGVRVGVCKPAASGCRLVDGQLIADDAVALWEAAGRPGTLDDVCPQRFLAPLAPHLAAEAEGRSLDERLLRTCVEPWRAGSEFLLVEGAGGLFSPLGREATNLDLAVDVGLPLLIVAANRLGAIHDVTATVLAARAAAPELPIAGLVCNRPLPPDDDASLASNAAEAARRAGVTLLACAEYGAAGFDRDVDWLAG